MKDNEPRRLALYKETGSLIRAYAILANKMTEAGYSPKEIEAIKTEVHHLDRIMPQWRTLKDDLNRFPLAHENWAY